jgi:HEAT repeat protein
MHVRPLIVCSLFAVAVLITSLPSCLQTTSQQALLTGNTRGDGVTQLGTQAHYDRVMTSAFCGTCHPDFYAEHEQNTHGRAFTDKEVRLATGNFRTADCIRCHTPRPIFETGIGNNPQRRFFGLMEGNTCMTCHWRAEVDYAQFVGGPDCKTAFDPRVGEVEACGACHKNHGTPFQWEVAPNGKESGRDCVGCHMPRVERPVAVGGPVRRVKAHTFPGARDEAHVAKAYEYTAAIEGNEAVVVIANTGAGHNFPTELRQRSLESLIVVRDAEGKEIARSRRVFRDPYRRPYGMVLPTNKQIPSGEEREHRVPLGIADGTVECELHFKYYFPIEDNHPELARRLEKRQLVFTGVTPNDAPVEGDQQVGIATPEGIDPALASPSDLGELAQAPAGTVEFVIPKGNSQADIDALVALFNFQLPEANRKAIDRLVEIGLPAVPALIEALGSWDNKTFHKSEDALIRIGQPAVPLLQKALTHESLYVRMHVRDLLGVLVPAVDREALVAEVARGLASKHALDRTTTCELLARLLAKDHIPKIRPLLNEYDPDVVRAAGMALAELGDTEGVPAIAAAMQRSSFPELHIDLGLALARLGSTAGVPGLLRLLDHPDELLREQAFEAFYAATGQHLGFEITAPHELRLAAIGRLAAWWHAAGPTFVPQVPHEPEPLTDIQVFHQIEKLGGGAGLVPAAENDQHTIDRIVAAGSDALPALVRGLKFPPGFAAKRASVLAAFQRVGDRRAAPFVLPILRDPVYGVAQWAAAALEQCGDAECLPGLRRFEARVRQAMSAGTLPKSIPHGDALVATSARTRLLLGDDTARADLTALLISPDRTARQTAILALEARFGDRRGYDPDAAAADRLRAAAAWSD